MSRTPNEAGIRSLRVSLQRMVSLNTAIVRLQAEIKERTEALAKMQSEYTALAGGIPIQLEEMDCKYPGNAGWEARMAYLLRELTHELGRVD